MSGSESKKLDRRLLFAGYVTAAIGYGVLLFFVLRPGVAWLAEPNHDDSMMTMIWVLSFAALGAALVNSGRKIRRAYLAGMQLF